MCDAICLLTCLNEEFECGPTDFLMLVCDGVSEGPDLFESCSTSLRGTFPNEAVIKLAAEKLKADEGPVDPAKAL